MTFKASIREKKQQSVAPNSDRTRPDLSCKTCGHVFESFLQEMAERNAKQMPDVQPGKMAERPLDLTCPKCGETHNYALEPSSQPGTSKG